MLTDVGETTFALPFCQVGIAQTPTLLSGRYGLSRLPPIRIAAQERASRTQAVQPNARMTSDLGHVAWASHAASGVWTQVSSGRSDRRPVAFSMTRTQLAVSGERRAIRSWILARSSPRSRVKMGS